jgi:hypothetical protein
MKAQGNFTFTKMMAILLAIIGFTIIYVLYIYFSEGSQAAITDIVFGSLDKFR